MHPLEAELQVFAPFLCPELRLWLLPPEARNWHASDPRALGMPYWAFAWPGGQVLARYLLDHPALVKGKRVLDFGSGCAIEGLAAAKCGASVRCADIDPRRGQEPARSHERVIVASLDLELAERAAEEIHADGVRAKAGLVEVEEDIVARAPDVEPGGTKARGILLAAILDRDDVEGARGLAVVENAVVPRRDDGFGHAVARQVA